MITKTDESTHGPSENLLRLDDGRHLSFIRWNELGHRPLLFCHGTPGSRLFRPADLTLLAAHDIDLITVDRPGYGRSTPQRDRAILDWPRDVLELSQRLGWTRFAVAGISGGGPHALACGFALPDRIAAMVIISSVAPFWSGALDRMLPTTRLGFQLARWSPWLLSLVARCTVTSRKQFLAKLRRELPDCDCKILARPEVAEIAAQNYAEALSSHAMALAMVHEMVLLCQDWGFALSDIRVPALLWHGELDRNVPVGHGYRIAQALFDCFATFLPDAGHYLVFDQWEAILRRIAADQYWVDDHSKPHGSA